MSKKDIGSTDDYKPLSSSRSPQAARHGNADPSNIGPGKVNLGMKNPTKNGDPANAGATEIYESGEKYKPLYEPK